MSTQYTSSFKAIIPIRWSDLDPYQHVHNVNYFYYMEEARFLWVQSFSDLKLWISQNNVAFIVINQSCQYLKEVTFPNQLIIHMKIVKLSKIRFTVAYEMSMKNSPYETCAKAFVDLVSVDAHSKKPIRLTELLRVSA